MVGAINCDTCGGRKSYIRSALLGLSSCGLTVTGMMMMRDRETERCWHGLHDDGQEWWGLLLLWSDQSIHPSIHPPQVKKAFPNKLWW